MDVWDRLVLPCRKNSLSSADKAATRRLVRSTFAKAITTQGKDLGEVRLSPLSPSLPINGCGDGGGGYK